MNFPEYLQLYKDDIYIKSARENKMVRVRNNRFVENIHFNSDSNVSLIVTFLLKETIDSDLEFYGVD